MAPSRVDWCSSPSRGSPSRGAPTVLSQNHPTVSTSTNLATIGANIRSRRRQCALTHLRALLRPDPVQRTRLEEIRHTLIARIAEAEREGRLGEVEGLQVSLAGAEEKLAPPEAARRLDAVMRSTKQSLPRRWGEQLNALELPPVGGLRLANHPGHVGQPGLAQQRGEVIRSPPIRRRDCVIEDLRRVRRIIACRKADQKVAARCQHTMELHQDDGEFLRRSVGDGPT